MGVATSRPVTSESRAAAPNASRQVAPHASRQVAPSTLHHTSRQVAPSTSRQVTPFNATASSIPACRPLLPSRCLLCHMHPATVPVLFTQLHRDGIGTTVDNMFLAVVYASRRGWNYGGAVNPQGSQLSSSSHNASHAVALNFFFGRAPLVNTAAPYANLRGSSRVTTVATVEALDAMTRPLSPGTRLWLTQTHPRFPWQPPSTAMLAALRAGAACSLARYRRHLRFAPGRRTVAVHLRRGDVSPSTSGNRCTPRPGPATWCVTIGHSRVPTHHAHAPGRQG